MLGIRMRDMRIFLKRRGRSVIIGINEKDDRMLILLPIGNKIPKVNKYLFTWVRGLVIWVNKGTPVLLPHCSICVLAIVRVNSICSDDRYFLIL